MSIRINWRQKSASDGCVRIHRILRNQPTRCQFAKMAGDIQDLRTEAEVLAEMRRRHRRKYKHCFHCWGDGGQIVTVS